LLHVRFIWAMRSLLILFFFPLFLSACANTLYMGKLAWGEARILSGAVPNEEVLRHKGVDEKIKDGIRLVQEVKEFSQQELGLRPDGSFETFYQVKGDTLIYLVSACPKDSLEAYAWQFPLVGRVEYKGFFNKKDALKEIHKLEKKGLDTCLQQAIAFSTLGWLGDPLYSTVLDYRPAVIINIIIHELVHNTVYFKGETEFNEQIASLIAEKGALMFVEKRFGLHSASYQLALDLARDEKLTARFFEELYDVLKRLYARDLPMIEKVKMREGIFDQWQRKLVELNKQLKVEGGAEPGERLNNAVVMAYRRYLPSTACLLQQAYEALGNNVPALVKLLLTMRKSKEAPYLFLQQWLEKRPLPPSG
jgi:predicted aminopeptidase